MKRSKAKSLKKEKQGDWWTRYATGALILGLIQGVITYFFLVDVCCTTLLGGFFNDPLALAPYIIVMGLVSVIALYLLIVHDVVNAALFLTFLITWLAIGFGSYYLFNSACVCATNFTFLP
ncbi:MAG: hypothetical protein ACHQX1_03245 [Candidatus Micrarchaeales archaeon]